MKTNKMVMASMLAALICIATMVIQIPIPFGYLNLGDAFVLVAAFVLPCNMAILASAIGAGLADILLGYAVYAPATVIIKGLMAFAAFRIYKGSAKTGIIAGVCAEIIMVLGYFLYEGTFLYGFASSLASVPLNALQGLCGVVVSLAVMKIIKNKIK